MNHKNLDHNDQGYLRLILFLATENELDLSFENNWNKLFLSNVQNANVMSKKMKDLRAKGLEMEIGVEGTMCSTSKHLWQ